MATATSTLSMPATTAPTDFTDTTCLPMPLPRRHSPPLDRDWETLDWDTSIVPSTGFPRIQSKQNTAFAAAASIDTTSTDETPPHRHQGDHWECECDEDGSQGSAGKSMEESSKRALEHFPNPAVDFPRPALEFDFRLAVTLKPEPSRIDGRRSAPGAGPSTGATPFPQASAGLNQNCAHKEITTISSGRWSGSFGNGKVMTGGYDLGQARGFRPIRIVEGAFVMQTTDEPPATLEMRTRGSLSGPSDVLDSLLSPRQPKQIDPRRYGFRMFCTIKTADKRYAEIVNCGLWVASGVWKGEEMIIDAYRVT